MGTIAIRRETKSPWERRTPVTPALARRLISRGDVEVLVQPSPRRIFSDQEFAHAGARLSNDLSEAGLVLGVKEIPAELLLEGQAYMFFSHVIKGQPYNMAMLARLCELGCTLLDYEMVADPDGRRLIFFGRFAGLAGMIDSLWALGRRLGSEGVHTPLERIDTAHAYDSLADALAEVRAAGREIAAEGLPESLRPLVIGIAGYGNVASGVREILAELPIEEVAPTDLSTLAAGDGRRIFVTTFKEEHMVVPTSEGAAFDLGEYYEFPERYRSVFSSYLPHLTALVNCTYWDARYPRVVTRDDVATLWADGATPKMRLIADISCDPDGGVECTLRPTDPGKPVYVYRPETGDAVDGVVGHGPVILAVEILPAELPREASEEFSSTLSRFLPALAAADWSRPLDEIRLPDEVRRAVIVHRGELTEEYRYLEEHLRGRAEPEISPPDVPPPDVP